MFSSKFGMGFFKFLLSHHSRIMQELPQNPNDGHGVSSRPHHKLPGAKFQANALL